MIENEAAFAFGVAVVATVTVFDQHGTDAAFEQLEAGRVGGERGHGDECRAREHQERLPRHHMLRSLTGHGRSRGDLGLPSVANAIDELGGVGDTRLVAVNLELQGKSP